MSSIFFYQYRKIIEINKCVKYRKCQCVLCFIKPSEHMKGYQRDTESSNQTIRALIKGLFIMRCRYNAVNFLENAYNQRPIVRPKSGSVMECLWWVQALMYVMPKSLQCCMVYRVILGCVITAPTAFGFCWNVMQLWFYDEAVAVMWWHCPRYMAKW